MIFILEETGSIIMNYVNVTGIAITVIFRP